jgi:predicted membrane protein
MEDLLEAITRDNVSEVKVVLASVVTALAIYQVLLMAVGYGKVRLPFLKPRPASFAHRASGDTIVLITLLIAFMCLSYFGWDDSSHSDDESSSLHAVAGILLIGVLGLKIVVIRWWHRMGRFLPALGMTVLVLFLVTWFGSVGNYFWGGS